MKNIILYTTHCPKCKLLKQKLDEAAIEYEENTNIDEMKALGIKSVPILSVDENLLSFDQAIIWVNQKGD